MNQSLRLADNTKLIVISHAGIKRINRAVYRSLRQHVKELLLVVPDSLTLTSGQKIMAEERDEHDPELLRLKLVGANPRTYFYEGLFESFERLKPNVILLENDPVSKLSYQVSKWCKRNDAKLICQTYDNLRRDFKSTLKTLGWKGLLKNIPIHSLNFYMATRVDALLVVNNQSEQIFNNYGYSMVFQIPLGYDPTVFFVDNIDRTVYREKLGVDPDTILIAYFGRLVPQKGVHFLIEALATLRSENWMLLLDHVHDSENRYASELKTLIAKNRLEQRVLYFEANHFEIAHYMRAADVSVAPSLTTANFMEQYGRAVQEAMACGCVTVVSDSGHLKNLVGQHELTFPEGNVQALISKLEYLIKAPHKRQGYRPVLADRAASNFTIDSQSLRLVSLLRTLEAKSKHSSSRT
jgi:glycosyltransferase involved in cell wall biosynthesis